MSAAAPIKTKFLVFSPESDSSLKEGKNALLNFYGKEAELVTASTLNSTINTAGNKEYNVVILLHAHGLVSTDPDNQRLYTDNDSKPGQPKTPAEVAKLIDEEWQIPKKHTQELRLIACYSDGFAQKLAKELGQRGYENTKITGYKGELNVSYGINDGIVAGLSLDLSQDKHLYKFRSSNTHTINFEALKDDKNLQAKYAAENFAVSANTADYYVNPQISQAAVAAAVQPASATNVGMSSAEASSGPLTRAAKQASGTASRKGSLSEPADSQVEAGLANRFSNAFGQLGSQNASGSSMKPSNASGTQSSAEGLAELSLFEGRQLETKQAPSQPSKALSDVKPQSGAKDEPDKDKPVKPHS